jgi:hypothetical protein
MWYVVLLLCLILVFGVKREGYSDDPAVQAQTQRGDAIYLKRKIAQFMTSTSPDTLDKYDTQLTALEQKVTELDVKMREFTETKNVNNEMGY